MLTDPSRMEFNTLVQLSGVEFDETVGTVIASFDGTSNVVMYLRVRHGDLKTAMAPVDPPNSWHLRQKRFGSRKIRGQGKCQNVKLVKRPHPAFADFGTF